MTAVAAALIARGHRVDAYTGEKYADAFADLGCGIVPWRAAQDFDERDLADSFPGVARSGFGGAIANMREIFIGTAAGQVADLRDAHRRDRFDAFIGDLLALGTGLAAEMLNCPWVSVCPVPLTLPSSDLPPSGFALRPGRSALGRVRDRALRAGAPAVGASIERAFQSVRDDLDLGPGLPFAEAIYSSQLTLATGSPSLEFPRSDLPETVKFVGRLAPKGPPMGPPPLWAETLSDEPRPVIFITQGTFDTDPHDLLLPALEGLAEMPVRVIGTTAGVPISRVPANARLVDFVPFRSVVPHASVGITNGGWGGVLEMLSYGVPLVVAGGTLDKPEVAARVAWVGAGLDLRSAHPRPARIAAAARRLLRDPSYRTRAQRIATDLEGLGGARRAAELIDRLISPGSPEADRSSGLLADRQRQSEEAPDPQTDRAA